MKFTLSWLKTHLDTSATLDEITAKLTDIGLEVENVEDKAAIYAPFKVVEIEHAEKHPNADRLKVCRVKTENGVIQVVCGASNARTGLKALHAPEGSRIPSNGMVMKKNKIRDVESNGMMVSLEEMAMADESEGIIEIDPSIAIGTPMAEIFGLNDAVIEINLTPNRPDCAGVRGIARDLAAAGLGKLKDLPRTENVESKSTSSVNVKITDDAKTACPIFLGRMIRGVKNGASPDFIAQKLQAIGQKPISALVDITNFMSIDLCRPLHVFDADKLQGDIKIRLSKQGETLAALNGKTYELSDSMTAVCDDTGVLGLGGIMGGESSSVSDTTTNVFLEVAYFDPNRTAKTGRALQINSDARYRFERGIDPQFTIEAVNIATNLIIEICGGEASDVVGDGEVPAWQRVIEFNPAKTGKLLGLEIEQSLQKEILARLGFIVQAEGDKWMVKPPSWRPDIEGEADLIEEIARIYGFGNLPSVPVTRDSTVIQPAETSRAQKIRLSRNALAASGLQEAVTWSFMPSQLAAKFAANTDNANHLRLTNPISADLDQMRPSILPNLIEAAKRNADKGHGNAAIFEIGPVFYGANPDQQPIVASGIRTGALSAKHWSGQDASRHADLYDAKADALRTLEACGIPATSLQISRDAPQWYHPGRSGQIRQGGLVLAYFGELHPSVLNDMDVKSNVVGFEAFIERVPEPKKKSGTALPLLKLAELQPVSRDFAFLADQTLEAESLIKAIKLVDRELITDVSIFDIYTGKGVDDGNKSVAVTVTLQPREKTLTDADIETLSKKIVDTVAQKTGATLRK